MADYKTESDFVLGLRFSKMHQGANKKHISFHPVNSHESSHFLPRRCVVNMLAPRRQLDWVYQTTTPMGVCPKDVTSKCLLI